jgi:salicylate hydroxylase
MKIIVVGGGIAGLAAAIAVSRMRHQVVVFERAPRIEERGAGLQIGPNGIKALDWLGALELLRDKAWHPQHVRFMDGLSGTCLRSIALSGSFDRRFSSPYLVAHRGDLLRSLLVTAESSPGIEIRTNSPVVGFRWQRKTPAVRLVDTEETADAVIGADGLHSTTRRYLLGDGLPRAGSHIFFRALAAAHSRLGADAQDVVLWLCPGGHVVHYPAGTSNLINFVAVQDGGAIAEEFFLEASPVEVSAAFPGVAPELGTLLGVPESWHKFRSYDRRPVNHWGTGPATLIGDAAHPMAPYLAQGAAAALEDAVALGQALDGTCEAVPALREYERRRIPRTSRLCRMSRRQAHVYHARGALARVRNLLLAKAPASVLMSQINWIYAWRP